MSGYYSLFLVRSGRCDSRGMDETMRFRLYALIAILFVFLPSAFSSSSILCKPMPSPTIKDAQLRSSIVIVSFEGYDSKQEIGYLTGVRVRYRVVEVLKAKTDHSDWNLRKGKTIEVIYAFQDGSACLPFVGWEFRAEKMPALQSKWILFLSDRLDGVFMTYRGDFGRLEHGEESLKKIRSGQLE